MIQGILAADPDIKQELGRRFAFHLGLTPGSLGADGGIDGYGSVNGSKVYFQSKLKSANLDAEEADSFYAKLILHQAEIAIMLAGIGYTLPTKSHPEVGFKNRLLKYPKIEQFKIHLLKIQDIFEENQTFQDAVTDLPTIRDLSREAWEAFRSSE